MTKITNIWFRSALDLESLAEILGFSNVDYDAENYWEWVIAELDGVKLDMTRTHKRAAIETDASIFRLDHKEFEPALKQNIVSCLLSTIDGQVTCGERVYLSGNEFDLKPAEVFGPDNGS